MNDDDERLAAIRLRHEALDFGMAHPDTGRWIARVSCKGCHRPWPCEQSVLLAEVERLEAALREIISESKWEARLTEWRKLVVTPVGSQPTPHQALREIREIARAALAEQGEAG